MTSIICCLLLNLVAAQSPSEAQERREDPFAGMSARAIVREGNRRLDGGEPGAALTAYQRAAELAPDAREVAFARGLAQFDLKQFEEARASFEEAAMGNDALATDARYSLGACDHAEALENTDNSELAMSLLESAMRRYHHVLDEQPEHAAAKDANYKAASVWRKIKDMVQQQPQQQQQSENDQQKNDKSDDEQNQQQPSDPNQDQEQKDQQQQSSSEEQSEEEKKEQQSAEQQKEQISREQAERQLREMMQALRQREKARQQPVAKLPIAPVEKDW